MFEIELFDYLTEYKQETVDLCKTELFKIEQFDRFTVCEQKLCTYAKLNGLK